MEQPATASRGTPTMVINVRAVALTMASLCTVVCGMRLYMRAFVVNSFKLDDFMVAVALFMVNGFSALAVTITYYGLGRHQNTVSTDDLLIFLKIYYVALCTYLLVAAAVKVSLTIFIMRIFPQRYIQYIGRCLLAFILVFSISGELVLVFQCKPVRAFFDKTIQGAKCWSSDTLFAITMYQGVIMFVMDIIILLLPMRAIWQLQMPLRKRLWLAFMFSFGIVASAAALVRFSTLVFTKDSTDATYSSATSLIWMEVEFNLGLLAGSLSSIRKLFKIKSLFSSQEHYTKQASTEQHELSSGYRKRLVNDQKHAWKGNGIMKTSEVITHVQGTRSESQERIVQIYGQSEPTSTTISAGRGSRNISQGGF